MKHYDIAINTHTDSRIGIGWRNAYHQSGHAAAFYVVNKQKLLPEVHFQIVIKPQESAKQNSGLYSKYTAKVERTGIIQNLPVSYTKATQALSSFQEAECNCDFEADVISLLAGPLAEAKYLSLRDGEPFNANLVNLNALHFYGGSSDNALVNDCLERFILEHAERKQKLDELFLEAFSFVNERANWLKITDLADFIRNQSIGTIPYEKMASFLGNELTETPKRQLTTSSIVTA